MGNCMETCMKWPVAEMQIQEQKEGEKVEGGVEKKSVVRIKVVLSREELEWLVLELKGQRDGSVGKRSLEDLLAEIERSRGCLDHERWSPSLESIMEGPEVAEMDRCG